ncbi:MAG TPA: NfeD family protein [Sedimentisphaerales bacterium]|nr:NfeD family protein [Sedimentisphaerales bacterium]
MKNWLGKFGFVLVCGLLLVGGLYGQMSSIGEANSTPAETPTVKAAVIVCKGMIDNGLYESIHRRTEFAIGQEAEYLIYEISTYGGLVSAADEISKYFLDAGKEAHTVAYITTEAMSAGAMISVHCQDIIMLENATIGDCAPMTLVPNQKLEGVEREKAESFIRGIFDRAAKANGYPEALLFAMVTMQIEVYRVKNIKTGEYDFFERVHLPKDPNEYDLDNKEVIVESDKLLTLIASDALEYGIARAVVKDRAGALAFLAERDGVTFAGEPMVLKTLWSEEMVRWLNSPAVMAVLIMLAMLGVYIEFNTPGVGLPGLAAVICFVIIIGSKYLVDLANWVEIALFVIGLLLLLIEIFVLPGFGIAGFLGITCILFGLFGMLVKNTPGELPWPRDAFAWKDFTDGVLGLSVGFVGFVVLAWLLAKYLPKLQFLSGLILVPTAAKQGSEFEVSMTTLPESKTVSVNVGELGEVISTLRPTGKAKFGNAMVDVVAEAEFLDTGTKVEIIEIRGNRVVVKAKERDTD